MNRIILLGVILFVFSNVFANDEMTKEKAIESICGDAGEYAKLIMHGRQVGVTIADAMKIANKSGMPEPKSTFFKSIIYNAYKEPMVYDGALQVIAESEYSNKVYMTCHEAMVKTLFEND